MFSICMTTYNGSRFVEEQLNSIIGQMTQDDELIICDDRSSDGTLQILEKFEILYKNVNIYSNEYNLGYVKNFEQVISLSKNDVIVLTDQDDIWKSNKLTVIKHVFLQNKKSNLVVHHGMSTIDSEGGVLENKFNYIAPSFNKKSRLIKLVTMFFRAKCYGCCLAMDKQFAKKILPFPEAVYSHDHWIELNAIVTGSILYIPDILIDYRQHNNNISPKRGLSLKNKILTRFKLVSMLYLSIILKIYK